MGNQDILINQVQNNGIQKTPEKAPKAPKKSVSKSGIYAVLQAMANGIGILLKNSTAILGISATISNLNSDLSLGWLKIISTGPNSLQAQIDAEANSGDDEKTKSAKLSALQAEFQQANTLSQQSQDFWTGLTQTEQQQGSATTKTVKQDTDIGDFVLATARTIVNLLA